MTEVTGGVIKVYVNIEAFNLFPLEHAAVLGATSNYKFLKY